VMSKIMTLTKFEITTEDGDVVHTSCTSEERALEICSLRRRNDPDEFHAKRKVVKEIRILGTEEIDVTDTPCWREKKDRVYASMVCKFCDTHPERKVNRQAAAHPDEVAPEGVRRAHISALCKMCPAIPLGLPGVRGGNGRCRIGRIRQSSRAGRRPGDVRRLPRPRGRGQSPSRLEK